MKKLTALLLAVIMCISVITLASCKKDPAVLDEALDDLAKEIDDTIGEDEDPDAENETEGDLAYITGKGKMVVGITDFAPMDYQGEDGEWIGFDADMAKAFAKYLGVDVEFQEIEWDSKVMELDSKNIDLVWNGMTLTDDVKNSMECSNAYCNNAQIVILPKDIAENYPDVESLKELSFAVENGSAGMDMADENGFTYTEVIDQATALLEVKSGTADAAIIDSLMAAAMVGEGTSYDDLVYTIGLNSEEYGVGFRKGSDAAEKLNEFFKTAYEDGTMLELAEKYGVQASLIEQ